MAKVRMLKEAKGSPDGFQCLTYAAGEEHVVGSALMPEELAAPFVNELKVAELIAGDEVEPIYDDKMDDDQAQS